MPALPRSRAEPLMKTGRQYIYTSQILLKVFSISKNTNQEAKVSPTLSKIVKAATKILQKEGRIRVYFYTRKKAERQIRERRGERQTNTGTRNEAVESQVYSSQSLCSTHKQDTHIQIPFCPKQIEKNSLWPKKHYYGTSMRKRWESYTSPLVRNDPIIVSHLIERDEPTKQ